MANSFTYLYPYIDKALLEVGMENFPELAQFDKDMEPAGGLTGRIPRTQPQTASSFSAAMVRDTGNSGTISGIPYSITNCYEIDFHVKYNEAAGLGARLRETVGGLVQEGCRGLYKAIQSGFYASGLVGHTYMPGCPNVVGTAGTTPFSTSFNEIALANVALARHNCPIDNRVGIVDLMAFSNLQSHSGLVMVDHQGTDQTLRRGTFGSLLGIDFHYSQGVPTWYCSGTPTSTGYVVGSGTGSGASGDILWDVYLTGDAGKFNAGDIFWFSGTTGHGQSHVIVSGVTFTTGGTGQVSFWPPLSHVVEETVGTGTNFTPYTGTRRQNLIAHRSAYRLVMRDPRAVMGELPTMGEHVLFIHPNAQVPLLVSFYPGDLMCTFAVKAYWEWVAVRPEWSCIVAG